MNRPWLAVSVALGVVLGIFASWTPTVDASRNPSGTYSLPSGNPVATGTSITSSWANTTLSDLASEITNSLDRNGQGGMIQPLRCADGSSSAPAFSWTSETGSGLYRAGSGDIRMQVSSTNVQKWSATTATFPVGITATQSAANATAVTTTGNGTGYGLRATGGSGGGYGIIGTGGGTNGWGVTGLGVGTGLGGSFTGGATDGTGVAGTGGNTNGKGVVGTGAGTGTGGQFSNGTAATGGTRRDALVLTNGDLSLDGVTEATSTTAVKNRLTPKSMVKAWGSLVGNGASPTVQEAFNVYDVSCATSAITVTIAEDFISGTGYAVNVTGQTDYICFSTSKAAGSFVITCRDYAGTPIDLCATTPVIDFIAVGRQ
jgi:hypothetical protein